jgi:poly(3-hydroxybutyrate) depolymerase
VLKDRTMFTFKKGMLASAMMLSLPMLASHASALTCTTTADAWNNGYVVNVTVTNTGTSPVSGWNLALNFNQSPGVTNSWNAGISTSGTTVNATNVGWNGNLGVGQSVGFGVQGTHNGNFVKPTCTTAGGNTPTPQPSSSARPSSSAAPAPIVSSSSLMSSSIAPLPSSAVASSSVSSVDTGVRNTITVRAQGTTGRESITLKVGGRSVETWTLTTFMANYTVETSLLGDIHVEFTNDDGGDADVRVDYVNVNGVTRQAEEQSENTGAWGGNQCGGGAPSEWLHCEGYINFGSVAGDTRPSSSSRSSSSSAISSAPATGGNGVGSSGCGAAAKLSNGRRTINVNGLNREYVLDIPSNYNSNTPYKLVFGWHWRGGSANDVVGQGYYGMKSLSNNTAIFVAPDRAPGTDGWTNDSGRDMAFLRSMLTQLKSSLCIDESRIFSTGWSYGGMMSFAVGREMADTFRAIAPVSGALWTPYVDSNLPTAAWIAHGTSDNVVGHNSGMEARDAFVRANGCSNQTVAVQPSPCVEYQNCSSGKPVVWCSFNGGHSQPSFYSSGAWNFFNRF